MSGDLDNLRELVAKLDEVQLDLEKVKSGLDKNFKNYKKVSDISTSISEKNKEVLESINTLHIEATTTVENAFEETIKLRETMSKYYSAENTKIKENFNALLSNMKSELITLKIDINRTIKDAANNVNIDTTSFANIINQKVKKYDISVLESFVPIASYSVCVRVTILFASGVPK